VLGIRLQIFFGESSLDNLHLTKKNLYSAILEKELLISMTYSGKIFVEKHFLFKLCSDRSG
jgi:hypothetical protein